MDLRSGSGYYEFMSIMNMTRHGIALLVLALLSTVQIFSHDFNK